MLLGSKGSILLLNAFGKLQIPSHDFNSFHLSNTIQASVLIVSDAARNVIRVQPSFNQMGHSDVIPINPAPKNGVSKKEKLPRPPNAFILYRQHHHPLIKAKNPGFHNNQICM